MNMNQQAPFALGVVLVAVCASPMAQAPVPAVAKPSFEVASVKPNRDNTGRMSSTMQPGGRYIITNLSLAIIIRNAFGVSQLVGLPEWGSSERFDIIAKAEQEFPRSNDKPSLPQLMMQSLLEERFKLVSHRETRDLPAYALVLARADGRLGPQLKPSDVDCDALEAARRGGGPPQAAPAPGERRPCTMTMAGATGGTLSGTGIPIASLVATLSSPAQRMVVNRTGLKGAFDFDLTFSRDPSGDTTLPSVFTAVQEQLGLKLESVRVPTEVLVIDSVDRPSPD
jgi:uncharacterized protein (TIGR03435 family)